MKKTLSLILLCHLVPLLTLAQNNLFENFKKPPKTAKPIVWWHWVGGNVTKEGITKDLEWMQRVGIGGFQAFDVIIGGGQTVEQKVKYRSPEWLALIKHAATEADRLGLEMTLVTAAGWSETGGTWVKPNEAMKKVVWSTLPVQGGQKFNGKLPLPPSVNGPIRNLPKAGGGTPFYADQVVLAYKTPDSEKQMEQPIITNHKGEALDANALLDDDLTTRLTINAPKPDSPVYLQYEYNSPQTIRSYSLAMGDASMFPSRIMRPGYLQMSQDGKNYQTILSIPGPQHDIRALPVRTFSFSPVTARFFRVVFVAGKTITTVGGPDDTGGFGQPATPPVSFQLAESILSPVAKVNRWEDKANFAPMFAFESLGTPDFSANEVIKTSDIVDLTSKLKSDGSLDWEVPTGDWTIVRLGYSLTGAKNGPASADATGYEVDKLNKEHLISYMNQWSQPLADALGDLYGKSLKYLLVDSYEADAQNWTETFVEEFKKRRGYDPTKYLPIMMGTIVESSEISDRFLWDYRLTIADLLVDYHYAAITEFAHQQGLKTYGEVAGISMPIIQDALRNKNAVDIPMAEFGMSHGLGSDGTWDAPFDLEEKHAFAGASERLLAHQSDVREAASAAHIYGKKIVAAESWTGGGYEAPADLKHISDYWFTQGINQVIFHTSAHQPLDTKPGNTMVGTHFNRNITWAEQAKPFVDYLTRTQYMLQEGQFVADVAYYLGEDIPVTVPYWQKLKNEAPEGYDYDFINAEILKRFEVVNGKLVLPNTMQYEVLVLPEKTAMSLEVLEKIAQLVAKGATIVGPKPSKSVGLKGFPENDKIVKLKANEIWGAADGNFIFKNKYGQGNVYWNAPLKGILGESNIQPDVAYTRLHTNTHLSWMHRKTGQADFYFVVNMRNQVEELEVDFRVTGKMPELWRADEAEKSKISYQIENGSTKVKLRLQPNEAVFVVFDQKTNENSASYPTLPLKSKQSIGGAWTLGFPENWGAPEKIELNTLTSWAENTDEGVRYFSGTATYKNSFTISKSQLASQKIVLDIEKVRDIAEVYINGKAVDILWKAPYQADIRNFVQAGKNTIELRVTNQWDNRKAGDSKLPNEKKILSPPSGMSFGGPPVPKESGLIGQVSLLFF